MKTYAIPLSVIHAAAPSRPAGYVEEVLSAGNVDGDRVLLSEDAYAALLRRYSGRTVAQAVAASAPVHVSPSGPGAELKALLKDWLGIISSPGCSCNQMAAEMDRRGPDWCESDEGIATILATMKAEHAKRWNARQTLLPWSDTAAAALVRLACVRARSKPGSSTA